MQRLIFVIAFSAVFVTAAAPQQLTKVRVGYEGLTMTSGPLIYAEKQDIFKKFGLDVAPAFVAGGSTLTAAVIGGSFDVAQNGYTSAAAAAVEGADVVIIGGISNKLPFQLVVPSSITNAAQLKGRPIAISSYGSSTDIAVDFALDHLKLSRDDVKVVQLGAPTNRIAALMSGQVSATVEQYPDTADLIRQGFHVLVDVTDIAGEYPNTSFDTTRHYLKGHPEVVKQFLLAMATAVHEYKTNPLIAIPLTRNFLQIKNEGDAKAAYEAYVKIYPDDLKPSIGGIQLVLKEIAKKSPKAATMRPEQLIDTSMLDAMQREGFFKKLAGK
jgi:NitT/TauT family transport system substrate-binding protein